VLYPDDNYAFSLPAELHSKVLYEANDFLFDEHWYLDARFHRDALRVSLSTPTDCVAPLVKERAIVCEARLAVNVDKLTERAIIVRIEHRS